jgi:hypothetical protein
MKFVNSLGSLVAANVLFNKPARTAALAAPSRTSLHDAAAADISSFVIFSFPG